MPVFNLQFTAAELVLLQAAILELPEKTRALFMKRIADATAPQQAEKKGED